MADMTREEAIAFGNRVIDLGFRDETQAFCEFAISDMERVEELEAENKRLKEDLSRWQEGEWNNCEECCNRLAYKLAELRDGIAKAKAEIHTLDDLNPDYPMDKTIHVSKWAVIEIINKYLGEVEHENEK